jgi:hypothetical protein
MDGSTMTAVKAALRAECLRRMRHYRQECADLAFESVQEAVAAMFELRFDDVTKWQAVATKQLKAVRDIDDLIEALP